MTYEFQDFSNELLAALQQSWSGLVAHMPGILLAILIVTLGFMLAGRTAVLTRKVFATRTQDPLMTSFLAKTARLLVVLLFITFALRVAGLSGVAAALFTAAGASAVIIGFAFRDIGENFISGIILSFNRPFKVDDTVAIGEVFGKVKALEFRYTKLKTFDGRDVYIPNSDVIKKPVFNYTEDGYFRLDFVVGIDYADRIEDAEALILDVVRKGEGVYEDEAHENYVVVDALSTSTVNLKVFFWVETHDYRKQAMMVRGRVIAQVKAALEAQGFSMPSDIQELKLHRGQASFPVTIIDRKGPTDR